MECDTDRRVDQDQTRPPAINESKTRAHAIHRGLWRVRVSRFRCIWFRVSSLSTGFCQYVCLERSEIPASLGSCKSPVWSRSTIVHWATMWIAVSDKWSMKWTSFGKNFDIRTSSPITASLLKVKPMDDGFLFIVHLCLDDKLYIKMELIAGSSLQDHLSLIRDTNQKLTEEQIWRVFIQLILALRYLHKEKGIVHRDITANNIMLDDEYRVKLSE